MSAVIERSAEWPLSRDEYARYGRQMIMPEWGLDGQLKVKRARIAVVGAGGLGCPALQYLAGAGVGEITIIDHDTVSASNLHRQVLHITQRVGMNKALSACIALRSINPHPALSPVTDPLTQANALSLLRGHDLVLDCTDRPFTRYLISDATVRLGIPLVSGAALGAAGQWAVYGGTRSPPTEEAQRASGRRACYRCLWPRPGTSARCDEAGVWGPATGIVGSGMASEALRILLGGKGKDSLHILHLGGYPMCIACGPNATITDDLESVDYDALCAGPSPAPIAEAIKRISVQELRSRLQSAEDIVYVDTRPPVEFGICALPKHQNIPFSTILASPEAIPDAARIVFICRRGNDSLVAAAHLKTVRPSVDITDVRGGLEAWSRDIDTSFPLY